GTLSRETKRDAESRERRAQLVRNVAEQSLLRLYHRFEPLGHQVEIASELADFIAPLSQVGRYPRAEISFSQLICRRAKFEQRRGEITREPVTKDAANHEHDEQSQT